MPFSRIGQSLSIRCYDGFLFVICPMKTHRFWTRILNVVILYGYMDSRVSSSFRIMNILWTSCLHHLSGPLSCVLPISWTSTTRRKNRNHSTDLQEKEVKELRDNPGIFETTKAQRLKNETGGLGPCGHKNVDSDSDIWMNFGWILDEF